MYGVRHDASARTLLCAWSTSAATPAPSCTLGPSRPAGSPEATVSVTPMILTARVVLARAPGTRTPLSSALTCGIPEPDAAGQKVVSSAATDAQTMEKPTNHGYAGVVSTERSAPKSSRAGAPLALPVSAARRPGLGPSAFSSSSVQLHRSSTKLSAMSAENTPTAPTKTPITRGTASAINSCAI